VSSIDALAAKKTLIGTRVDSDLNLNQLHIKGLGLLRRRVVLFFFYLRRRVLKLISVGGRRRVVYCIPTN
jgi:hypothetical protein